jgi:hypothetical protein
VKLLPLALLLCLGACSAKFEAPFAGVRKGAKVEVKTFDDKYGGTRGYVAEVTKEGVQIDLPRSAPPRPKGKIYSSEEGQQIVDAMFKPPQNMFFPWSSIKAVKILEPANSE